MKAAERRVCWLVIVSIVDFMPSGHNSGAATDGRGQEG